MTQPELLAPDLLAYVQPDLEQIMSGVMFATLNIVNYNIEVRPELLALGLL